MLYIVVVFDRQNISGLPLRSSALRSCVGFPIQGPDLQDSQGVIAVYFIENDHLSKRQEKWMQFDMFNSGQTEQQTKVLPGGHRLLSEYFQSCDSKRISCPGSVLLQETNLLPRFSLVTGNKSPAPVQWAGRGQISW